MQPQCSHETWLSRNVCKTKNLNLLEKSKAKSLRNLGSQFGISVGAVNNFLKRKREYNNLDDPLG